MSNHNRGNGHLSAGAGLDQLGPVHSTGGGYYTNNDTIAARKPKSITARVNMSAGHRKVKPKISLPRIG